MNAASANDMRSRWAFWLLAGFLCLVFLTGGASRIDVQSLVFLRPVSVALVTLALVTLRRSDLIDRRGLLLGLGAVMLLTALHLIPLPPVLWQNLPGHALLISVDTLAGIGAPWRPLSLTPTNGWHSLLALFAPLAVLLLGVQTRRRDLQRLLPIVLVMGGLSAVLGVLQVAGAPGGPAYLYSVTNPGSAVGLFANRNHAALLLAMMFPLLALWVTIGEADDRSRRMRLIAAVLAGIVLVPLVVVTGSRSGLLLSLVGLAAAVAIYLRDGAATGTAGKRPLKRTVVILLSLAAVAVLGLMALYLSRGEAVRRLLENSIGDDTRMDQWRVALRMAWDYFPFGSGAGSIAEVYQVYEPHALVNRYYFNHVHNDFLEIVVTFGLPGAILMLVGVWAYARRCKAVWSADNRSGRSIKIARVASIAILMIGLASVADYPLRTPTILCIFAVFLLWFFEAGRSDAPVRRLTAATGEEV